MPKTSEITIKDLQVVSKPSGGAREVHREGSRHAAMCFERFQQWDYKALSKYSGPDLVRKRSHKSIVSYFSPKSGPNNFFPRNWSDLRSKHKKCSWMISNIS